MSPVTTVDPKTAKRSYSAVAYYAPNSHRKNLLVVTGAIATKVIICSHAASVLNFTNIFTFQIILEKDHSQADSESQRAVGVEFVKDGVTTRVSNINRVVVLSAGV